VAVKNFIIFHLSFVICHLSLPELIAGRAALIIVLAGEQKKWRQPYYLSALI
jgi:hypothetical protein